MSMNAKQAKGIWDKYAGMEHPHAACFADYKDKMEDAHAFCAAVEEIAAGTTPAERAAKKHALRFARIDGVEVFAAGKHNGDEYSEADLDAMIEAFNALDFRPAIKLGHTDGPSDPAYGYLANLRRVGSKLVADFVDLQRDVYEAIRAKKFERVSAEVFWNLERAGKKFKRALKAVALLGSAVPAVAGLKPLSELFADMMGEVRAYDIVLPECNDATTEGEADMATPEEVKELQERLAAAEQAAGAEKTARADLEKKLSELSAKLETFTTHVGAGDLTRLMANIQSEEARAKLTAMSVELEAKTRALKAAEEARAATQMQLDEATRNNATLAERQRQGKIDAVVATCRIPALRDFLYQYLNVITAHNVEKVYSMSGQPIAPLDAAAAFVKFVNQNALGLFRQETQHSETFEGNVSQEVDRRARQYMREHNLGQADYGKAMATVLDADPALKREYAAPVRSATA